MRHLHPLSIWVAVLTLVLIRSDSVTDEPGALAEEETNTVADHFQTNVGVTFNLCHWLRSRGNRDLRDTLERAMPHLFVVSINGANSEGQSWNELIQTLDRGSFDVEGFLNTLLDVGYNGPIGLQGYDRIGGDAHENLSRSIQAWKDVWAKRNKRKS